MLSWQSGNQWGFCDSRKKSVKTRQRGETIVTVTNWLPQLNWDSCGFQARLSITAASINGAHLNDKTISHEQAISLSSGQGLFECNSVWVERFHRSHMEFGFASSCWLHPSIMTECVITKCLPLNPCYNWQHSAVTRDGGTKWKAD